MLDAITRNAPAFLLISARIVALIMTAPLLSINSVPRVAKIALGGLTAFAVMPSVLSAGWDVPPFSIEYALLVIGEALIGVITGFYINMIFASFSSAGQFFSYQMGFGASEVYDALAQVENPLMGQFLNIVAMIIFLQIDGFRTLFLGGVLRSFQSLNAATLAAARENFLRLLLSGLTSLFFNALFISLPLMGTLFIITIANGLLSKAAPQINLLSEGLPITITVAFILLFLGAPVMIDVFISVINAGFGAIESLFIEIGGAAF